MTAWKAHERRIARRLGGQRNGATGKATADVETNLLAIECKQRTALPKWLHKAMQQAVDAATATQMPIVVLHELGKRSDGDYVVIRLGDFQSLYAGVINDHMLEERSECN
ncbi:MAG: hypothetical protein KDE47_34720 [Caldilineaceae bacterium]|nr:hypothetical protein [Caldilineaceae bacterium]